MFAMALLAAALSTTPDANTVVSGFLSEVRSGKHPERASVYLADRVLAHQMNSENEAIVERSGPNYADHVREFLATFGPYQFQVTEQMAVGDKVFVRWQQDGRHIGSVDKEKPTGLPLREIGSAVYRVADGKIVEYWIQLDRHGFEQQLKANAARAAGEKQ